VALIITEEEKMLKEAARELLESKASISQFRSLRDENISHLINQHGMK
jgi:hypothetical protein